MQEPDLDDHGADTVGTPELPGQLLFLVSAEAEATAVWDAARSGSGNLPGNAVRDTTAPRRRGRALDHRPVRVARGEGGGPIRAWDPGERAPLTEFGTEMESGAGEETLTPCAPPNVSGRRRVAAAGGCGSLALGDIDRGAWSRPFAGNEPPDETDPMVAVGAADGVPIAVTGTGGPRPAPASPARAPEQPMPACRHSYRLGRHRAGPASEADGPTPPGRRTGRPQGRCQSVCP